MEECQLYSEPALYDLLFPNAGEDAPVGADARIQRIAASERFYVDQARRSSGPVLELACGSGRLTVPVAKAGVPITGADLSAPMLAAARAKAAGAGVDIEFMEADMRTFDLGRRFNAIFITGNSLLHLLRIEDLKACLRRARSHLTPGGRLVFDISKWDLGQLAGDSGERRPVLNAPVAGRGEITIEETATYDSAEQVRHMVWYVSGPSASDFRIIDYSLRVIFPQELLLLIEATGFGLDARYGEFTLDPFDSSSPRQVCICSALE
jgi:SAM-dependent methyltransferase